MPKKSTVGFEFEMFVLGSDGRISNTADRIIRKYKRLSGRVKKEYGKSMIELTSIPHPKVRGSIGSLMHVLSDIIKKGHKTKIGALLDYIETGKDEGYRLLPFGTYPGKFNPEVHSGPWYEMHESVFGQERFRNAAAKVCGFHFHYQLPKRIFDYRNRTIRMLFRSKTNRILINEYNILVAADPAVTTLLESSPFFDGRHYAKDCRLFAYRDLALPKEKGGIEGIYSRKPLFGELPHYKHTLSDIVEEIEKKNSRWAGEMERAGFDSGRLNSPSPLDFNWGPVKINSLGTFEQRSMDMNHPYLVIGVSILFKRIFRQFEESGLNVLPSDIGVSEPFKVEGGAVHVPPISRTKKLEYISAVEGFSNPAIADYCKRFYRFALRFARKDEKKALFGIRRIISERQSVSDIILNQARKMGFSIEGGLEDWQAAELALWQSDWFSHELKKADRLCRLVS